MRLKGNWLYAALAAEVDELQKRVAATKAEYESAAAKLAERRACLVECEREHSALAAEKSELQGKLGEAAAERKRVAHRCAMVRDLMSTLQLACHRADSP